MSEYLASKGLLAPRRPLPQLDESEAILESDIGRLMQIYEQHYDFWAKTDAIKTTDMLSSCLAVAKLFLAAIHTEDNRKVKLFCEINKYEIEVMIKSIRAPVKPRNIARQDMGQDFRVQAKLHRKELKTLFMSIISQLNTILQAKSDWEVVTKSIEESKVIIQEWANSKYSKIKDLNEEDELDNEDGLELSAENNKSDNPNQISNQETQSTTVAEEKIPLKDSDSSTEPITTTCTEFMVYVGGKYYSASLQDSLSNIHVDSR